LSSDVDTVLYHDTHSDDLLPPKNRWLSVLRCGNVVLDSINNYDANDLDSIGESNLPKRMKLHGAEFF
jgi:hypothetical protein